MQPEYIVEVVIHAWNAADPRNDGLAVGQMRAHPIHTSDDGKAYRRGDATVSEVGLLTMIAILHFLSKQHLVFAQVSVTWSILHCLDQHC